MTIGANCPYRFDTREDAAHLERACPGTKWIFKPASLGRTGINSMFNHNAEWWLVGVLGIVIARVPARFVFKTDGVNISSQLVARESEVEWMRRTGRTLIGFLIKDQLSEAWVKAIESFDYAELIKAS